MRVRVRVGVRIGVTLTKRRLLEVREGSRHVAALVGLQSTLAEQERLALDARELAGARAEILAGFVAGFVTAALLALIGLQRRPR